MTRIILISFALLFALTALAVGLYGPSAEDAKALEAPVEHTITASAAVDAETLDEAAAACAPWVAQGVACEFIAFPAMEFIPEISVAGIR